MPSFIATSDAVDERGFLDPRFTCDLDNSSPEIRWENPPSDALAFAVTFEALDLPGMPVAIVDTRERPVAVRPGAPFAHWLVYNIPAGISHLPPGIPPQDTLPNGIRQGLNGASRLGYLGPCPPRNVTAREYVVRVLALSRAIELPSRLGLPELMTAIAPFILAESKIRIRYSRTQIARPA